MTRQKKRWRRKHGKAKRPQSEEELAGAAAEHLQNARFKEAVDEYKRLVKSERRAQWVDALARAYAGRAEQLASRGMLKEAIALWQNRAEACARSLADPRYLEWLMVSGRTGEVVRLYREDPEALAGAEGLARLRARLAAAALADAGKTLAPLSAEDPIKRDFAAADAALVAYADGDDSTLDAALARIPFRSPYRDLRQILKAMLRREQDAEAAGELLARVPEETPFVGLRRAVAASTPAARESCSLICGLPMEILDVAAALAGWSREQIRALTALMRLEPAPSRAALLKFILGHRQMLGEPFAREAAFTVASTEPRLARRLDKAYRALPEWEKWRLRGQAAEVQRDFPAAEKVWLKLLDVFNAEPASEDNLLRRALIYRHLADMDQPAWAGPPFDPTVVHYLEQSLNFDPEDRASILRVIAHYLHVGDLKAARKWVDRALTQHPRDAECLLKAAQTAVAGGAYKKAARFAERLLEIDPINPRVRGLLVDSHQAHARKQIRAGKHAAARTELAHASEWARSTLDEGRGQILAGLVALDEDTSAGELLRAGMERVGGGLQGRFHLLLEAYRAGRNLKAVTRTAALPGINKAGDSEQVLDVIRAVNALREAQYQKTAVEAALKALAPAIKREAKAGFSYEQFQFVCETLLRFKQYTPLRRYAQTASQRHPMDPLFMFYKIQSRLRERPLRPFSAEFEQLENAYELALANDDMRTGERIKTELDKSLPQMPSFDVAPLEPFPEDEIGSEDALAELIAGAPNQVVFELFEQILGTADLERLMDAFEDQQAPPPELIAKLQAGLHDKAGQLGGTGGARGGRKKRGSNARRRQEDAPYQDELFGEWE